MPSGKLLLMRRPGSSVEALSDAALVAACQVGDTGALAVLFDRHQRMVCRYFGRVLGQFPDLEDLVQNTFLELWRSAAGYRGRGSVKSWILGIASNLFRHHVRGKVRQRVALQALSLAPERVTRGPEDLVGHEQRMVRLQAALLELSEDHRDAFVLCDLEELTIKEAALALGARPGTIGRRVTEARRALRQAIEGGGP